MGAVNPKRSRSGPVNAPDRVVAPTKVNGATSSGIDVAPGAFPTTTSTRKSSIARYSIASAGRGRGGLGADAWARARFPHDGVRGEALPRQDEHFLRRAGGWVVLVDEQHVVL